MAKKFDAKAKAKRQKIILAVLGVAFIGVLAWQVPGVIAIMNKKPATAAAPAPAPATTPPGAPVPPISGTPIAATGTPAPSSTLVDSDPGAQAAGGQLVTFDRFESKDPFAQQLTASGQPAAEDNEKPTRSPTTVEPSPPSPSKPAAAPAPTSAEISVNGAPENVSVGGTFPQAEPMFVLVSVTRTTAKVAISGGSLDNGGATVTLARGKKLTLENTVDGSRYTLVLVATR